MVEARRRAAGRGWRSAPVPRPGRSRRGTRSPRSSRPAPRRAVAPGRRARAARPARRRSPPAARSSMPSPGPAGDRRPLRAATATPSSRRALPTSCAISGGGRPARRLAEPFQVRGEGSPFSPRQSSSAFRRALRPGPVAPRARASRPAPGETPEGPRRKRSRSVARPVPNSASSRAIKPAADRGAGDRQLGLQRDGDPVGLQHRGDQRPAPGRVAEGDRDLVRRRLPPAISFGRPRRRSTRPRPARRPSAAGSDRLRRAGVAGVLGRRSRARGGRAGR